MVVVVVVVVVVLGTGGGGSLWCVSEYLLNLSATAARSPSLGSHSLRSQPRKSRVRLGTNERASLLR